MRPHQYNILGDDIGRLELIDWLGDDLTVVNTARVSYGKESETFSEADGKLLTFLATHGHLSPFRHVQLQFRVKAPIFIKNQWMKHMVGAEVAFKDQPWNEVSQRYVKSDLEFYIPLQWRKQATKNKQASAGVLDEVDQLACNDMLEHYYDYVKATYVRFLELGIAREQARIILPLATYTEWIWTASLQAVVHFILLRDHPGAQWEIRQYALAMREMCEYVAPMATAELLRGLSNEED